jgi:hypothetical protein
MLKVEMAKRRAKAIAVAGVVVIAAALVTAFLTRAPQEMTSQPKSYAKLPGTWTYDCEFPVQRPAEIMLTCADGGMVVTEISWQTWTQSVASGNGIYSENLCEPDCADGTRVEVPVTVKLSEPFEYKGRNVLRRLEITAETGRELPNGDSNMSWDVAEFAVRMNWDVE